MHPAKIRAALRVGAAPAPRRVAGSLNRELSYSPRQRLASHPAALPTLLYEIEPEHIDGLVHIQPVTQGTQIQKALGNRSEAYLVDRKEGSRDNDYGSWDESRPVPQSLLFIAPSTL